MKVFYSLEEYVAPDFPVVTTGTFDGVHLGHRKIIERINHLAQQHQGESVLVTFHPHPRLVLNPDADIKLLTTIEERIELLRQTGIDNLIIVPFTPDFSRLSSVQFVRDVLVTKVKVRMLIVGYDHQFGRNREGSFENLEELGTLYDFSVENISAHEMEEVNVSSTKIRKALLDGELHTAVKYLGYNYSLSGTVVSGDGLGKKIGFPTANISVQNKRKLIPANGVYAVQVEIDGKRYKGMLNIGVKPTVSSKEAVVIEVNILNFHGDLYGKKLRVTFISRLRSEMKFENVEALREQLLRDRKATREVLKDV